MSIHLPNCNIKNDEIKWRHLEVCTMMQNFYKKTETMKDLVLLH